MLDQVENWLQARQLEFARTAEDTIASGFTLDTADGREQGFHFYVMQIKDPFEQIYLRLIVVPFVEQPYNGYPAEIYTTVGLINHDLPRLKFAFDSDGDLELLLDLPASEVDEEKFGVGLQLIADYAGGYYPEVAALVPAE